MSSKAEATRQIPLTALLDLPRASERIEIIPTKVQPEWNPRIGRVFEARMAELQSVTDSMTAATIAFIRDNTHNPAYTNDILSLLEQNEPHTHSIGASDVVYAFGYSKKGMSQAEVAAIKRSEILGAEITLRFPHIAVDYQTLNQNEIIEKYDFEDEFSVGRGTNAGVLKSAVRAALMALLPPDQYEALAKEHQKRSHRKAGEKRKEERSGVFNKVGLVFWSEKEGIEDYFLGLCKNPEYQYKKGPHTGRPNYRLIAEELERAFGITRHPKSLERYKNRPHKT